MGTGVPDRVVLVVIIGILVSTGATVVLATGAGMVLLATTGVKPPTEAAHGSKTGTDTGVTAGLASVAIPISIG